jgi:hypothetical protein
MRNNPGLLALEHKSSHKELTRDILDILRPARKSNHTRLIWSRNIVRTVVGGVTLLSGSQCYQVTK